MEILKRVINLIYALFILVELPLFYVGGWEWVSVGTALLFIGITSLVFGVINFSLFKKLTVWNK